MLPPRHSNDKGTANFGFTTRTEVVNWYGMSAYEMCPTLFFVFFFSVWPSAAKPRIFKASTSTSKRGNSAMTLSQTLFFSTDFLKALRLPSRGGIH